MIKVVNCRLNGSLFHYAHFICDCLFPEIIYEVYKHDSVYRVKNIEQTLGNFENIYNDVMNKDNFNNEIEEDQFKLLSSPIIKYNKNNCINHANFIKFRKYIFNRYNIKPLNSLNNINKNTYPDVVLIKRSSPVELISDPNLKIQIGKWLINNGSARREIKDIHIVEQFLQKKYKKRFKSYMLENLPFEEQVKIFYNAKMIVCAHGAGMSNMFFCKPHTRIIEVTCNRKWPFFNIISNILNLKHVKCLINRPNIVINFINYYGI